MQCLEWEKRKKRGGRAGVEESKRRVCRSPQCIKSRRDVDAEVEERARASTTVRFAGTGTYQTEEEYTFIEVFLILLLFIL